MKLYHGSDTLVKAPRILAADHIGDFGTGFYTTTDPEQARRFVRIKCDRKKLSTGHVSIFEAPDDLLDMPSLRIRTFRKADKEWLKFVEANRKNPGYRHDFDIIQGPVANDQVYASLALYEADLLSFEELLERLKVRRLTDQLLFHTVRALLLLTFTGSEVIECPLK